MRPFVRTLLRWLFGFCGYNTEVLKTPGPVLLIPNHVSWFDWLFLGALLDEDWKFVTSSVVAQASPLHKFIMVNKLTFPIDTNSPYAVKHMAEYLQKGGRLVLFAEGRISTSGTLLKLFDGTGFLIYKTHAKVITGYLRGAMRMPLSPQPGWKRLVPRVTAHFSEVHTPPEHHHLSTAQARTLLANWLRDRMIVHQFNVEMEFGPRNLVAAIAETARKRPGHVVLEDVTAQRLTYRRLLAGADVLGAHLKHRLGDVERVGVLLPNINATPVLLLALWNLGKTPAMLNFSTGTATMLACAKLAGLRHIVTSRVFLQRARLQEAPLVEAGLQMIYLEDLRGEIGGMEKIGALLRHSLFSPWRENDTPPDRTAAVLFTSGSEGVPKGVELSHGNILANVRQMLAVTDFTDNERIFNCLPLFHSFGLTVGMMVALVRGLYTFIYPSPLHYRVVPNAVYFANCTVFLGTNTFLNGYARKAHAYDFRSLRYLFAAAEKLQEATAITWARRFGVRVLEGYGATECSPCVSVNHPMQPKHGSVGRLLPGIECKLEAVEGVAEGGRLFVRGPNVMKGYLNEDANAHFKELGGWYDTGDVVRVDEEGFLHVSGRMKRFAKVSGEMISLTAVEDALAGAFPQYGLRCQIAILTRPDEDKGEALIAVTNEGKLQLDEIRAVIRGKGMTNLSVPREIRVVREIPKLGTGKVNHRELEAIVKRNE